MKKILACLLVVVMVCMLGACGSKDAGKPSTPGTKMLADFQERMAGQEEYTIEEMANAIIESKDIPVACATAVVEEGYLNGFMNEVTGFQEGVMFGPMIGTIPMIGYIFQLEDGADVDAFVEGLKENADMRWNICTEAGEMVCDAEGQRVFFVMCPLSFDE